MDETGEFATPPKEIAKKERPPFTEEREQQIRQAVRWQIENPVDTRDFHVSILDADRRMLVSMETSQNKANLVDFTLEQAERWLQVVKEEMDAAREGGVTLVERDWGNYSEHEMDHVRTAFGVGVGPDKCTLSVHFGMENLTDGTEIINWQVKHDISEPETLHPVDLANIALAPQDPSYEDMTRFVQNFRANRSSFIERPAEASNLVLKFHEVSGGSVLDTISTLFGKQ